MLFDARLHARSLRAGDLDDLRWFRVGGALVPMDDAVAPPSADAIRQVWKEIAPGALRRLRKAGLVGRAALGIHPGRIPARGLEALLQELPEHLGRPGVAAIGEIGLLDGGPREQALLERQLELAAALRLPVVVVAPRRRRLELTRRLLETLRSAELPAERVLFQDVDPGAVRMVRACGHGVGVSLSRAPEALDEAVRLVRRLGPEGLVLSSGAGHAGGDLLALPRVAARLRAAGLSAAVVRRVCGGNAQRLLGVPERGTV